MASREEPLTEAEIRNGLNELRTSARYYEGRLVALTEIIVELSKIIVEMQKAYPSQKLDIEAQLNASVASLLQKHGDPQNAGILLGIQTVQKSLLRLKE